MTESAKLLEDSLLLIWNSRDAVERIDCMKNVYAPDIAFFEGNASEAVVGYEAINTLIGNLQANWPPSFLFTLLQPGQVNHEVQYVTWVLGAAGESPVASGKDIAITENGRIKAFYLFLDGEKK